MAFRTIGLAALALSVAATAAAAPGNGKLAYFRNPSIFTANADGSAETLVATVPTTYLADQTPLWSPDGAHLAYLTSVESPGIVEFVPEVVDADGGNPKQLAAHGNFLLACWLDASTLVAVATYSSEAPFLLDEDLYAFGLDGSVRRLTADGLVKDVSPQGCAPDGSAVAYAEDVADRSRARVVSADGSRNVVVTPAGVSDTEPSWSPRGDELAFTRYGTDARGLYASDPTGDGARRVSSRPAAQIRWSPDGASILYAYYYTDYSRCSRFGCPSSSQIWKAAADGSGDQLLAESGSDVDERWSPDGQRILFARGGRNYVMNADGSCKTVLPANVPPSADWQPVPGLPPAAPLVCADLKISADATQLDLPLRGQRSYTVSVTNQGNATASSVLLDQPAVGPATIARAEASQGSCTTEDGIHCELGGLAAGASATVDVQVQVDGPGRAILRASVSAPEPDGDPFDNSVDVFLWVHDCTILGTAGADLLLGTPKRDRICGLFGDDRIYGGKGNDVIYGGEGADTIVPGRGRDVVHAGGGEDIVLARDGERDVIDCGPEKDVAVVDRLDVVSHCRTVYRPANPPRRDRR
jgi:hypothetical protein